ncbi:MAG TPA: hypothetical protein VIW29_21740 [Polyangiaceae bacterium]
MSSDAGAGGEAGEAALGSGGSEVTPQAGMPGVTAGSGGEPTEPGTSGASGVAGGGGEPAVLPGEGGSGGVPSSAQGGAPSGSACGEGQYDAYEAGCQQCPALPNPNYPTTVSCQEYHSASYDSQSHTLYLRLDTEIHEALSGKVSLTWTDDGGTTGSGEYDWTFDPQAPNTFAIVIPDAPVTAQAFDITYFAFTDACGFLYAAQSLPIAWDVETWSCGGPASGCGFGSYDNGQGCSTCPADPPVAPIELGCSNYTAADFNGYENWFDISFDAGIHEAFSGGAHLSWEGGQEAPGAGEFSFSYDPSSNKFRFYVDTIPDTAQDFTISGLAFTDACGFSFEIGYATAIVYDGAGYGIDCGG